MLGYAKKNAVLQGFESAAGQIKTRLEKTFIRLHEHCPTEFIEGWTEIFLMENPIALEYEVTLIVIQMPTPLFRMPTVVDARCHLNSTT